MELYIGKYINVGGVYMNIENSTIFMIIGFLILIGILIIIVNQRRMLDAILSLKDLDNGPGIKAEGIHGVPVQYDVSASAGHQIAQGQTKLVGSVDDETVAAIIAAVSSASNIPLSSLQIKSIKTID
jgi:hypothetical protein